MRLAGVVGAIDEPRALAVHATPTPRYGGFAIGAAALLTALVGLLFAPATESAAAISLLIVAASVFAVWVLGLIEDARPLRSSLRLGIELVAGLVVGAALVWSGPYAFTSLAYQLPAILLMSVWLAGTANAVNMIDGLNGLAASCALISGLVLAAIGYVGGGHYGSIAALAVAGACLGFLPWNFPNAKTFMGDSGSLFLGFALAAAALVAGGEPWAAGRPQVLVGCAVALGIPVADAALAMARRALNGRPLMQGDRGHFYDQLGWRLGLPKPTVTLVCALLSCALGVVGLACALLPLGYSLGMAASVVISAAAVLTLGGFLREAEDEAGELQPLSVPELADSDGPVDGAATDEADLVIVPGEERHMGRVAHLHCEALPGTFLTSLGPRALTCVYSAIAATGGGTMLVAESTDGRFLGFVCGTASGSGLMKGIVRRSWPSLLQAMGLRLFSPRLIIGVLQTLTQSKDDASDAADASAELLSIAVAPEARQRGIGQRLVASLEERAMLPAGITEYYVATSAEDPRSNAFYRSLGFRLRSSYRYHGAEMNRYCKALLPCQP